MALSSPLPVHYPSEPQTYVSTASIRLRPSNLGNSTKLGEALIFEWHTNVATPPNTPAYLPPPPQQPATEETIESSHTGSTQAGLPMRSLDLYTPAFTFDEKDDLKTKLDKFMSCERYNSQYSQMWQTGNGY